MNKRARVNIEKWLKLIAENTKMRSSPIRGLSQQLLAIFFSLLSLFIFLFCFCYPKVICSIELLIFLKSWMFIVHAREQFVEWKWTQTNITNRIKCEDKRCGKHSTRKKTSQSFKIGIPLVAQNNFVVANEFHLDEFKFNQYGCFMLHLLYNEWGYRIH